MGPYTLTIRNGQYRLQICKYFRDNFEKTEKALDAQVICWVRKAIPEPWHLTFTTIKKNMKYHIHYYQNH